MIELTIAILVAAVMLTIISNISFIVNVGLILLTVFVGGSVVYKYMSGQDITSDYIMSIMSVVLLFIIYKSIKVK